VPQLMSVSLTELPDVLHVERSTWRKCDTPPCLLSVAELSRYFRNKPRGQKRLLDPVRKGLGGRRCPIWESIQAYMKACGEDPEALRPLREDALNVMRRRGGRPRGDRKRTPSLPPRTRPAPATPVPTRRMTPPPVEVEGAGAGEVAGVGVVDGAESAGQVEGAGQAWSLALALALAGSRALATARGASTKAVRRLVEEAADSLEFLTGAVSGVVAR
jgi:hypothetical protein